VQENPFNKISSLEEVLDLFYDGCSIMFGGFGGIGSPPTIIDGILKKGVKELTLIGNDTGFPDIGIGRLIKEGRAKKVIASHIGSNPIAGQLMENGQLEVEFSPQGTLVERIRAGGVGISGILVDVGIGIDVVEREKEKIVYKGKEFLIEEPLRADFSIVFAKKSDPFGNLIYDKTARNTNPLVAMAGEITIAEVEEIVPLGDLNPEEIVTPGIFVQKIVQSEGVNWTWVWEQT
jgi:acetate CoA/acetoacetate CoA-transferase alpha subunit